MIPRTWMVGVTLAAIAGSGLYGFGKGYAAAEAKQAMAVQRAQAEAIRAAEIASRKEAERLAAEAARDAIMQQLEDEAHADPITVPQCLSAGRVRRLNAR